VKAVSTRVTSNLNGNIIPIARNPGGLHDPNLLSLSRVTFRCNVRAAELVARSTSAAAALREGESWQSSLIETRVNQQQSLKAQLSDQINLVTRRCAVQEQAAARWRTLRAEVALQELRVRSLRHRLTYRGNKITVVQSTVPKADPISNLKRCLDRVQAEQHAIDVRILAAKRVLVLEAAAVMGLQKGRIAGLPLTDPRDMKRGLPLPQR
jgi:hypothetical protein